MRVLENTKFELALKANHSHYLMNTFREQFYFGTREVLLEYMNLPMDSLILADIQHGYPRMLRRRASRFGAGRFPDLVWSNSNINPRFTKTGVSVEGDERAVVIGAPWLYMRMNVQSRNSISSIDCNQRKGRLFVLPHSDNFMNVEVDGYLPNVLKVLLPTSMLLFNEDFLNPKIRQIAEAHGVEVECAGLPRTYQPTAYATLAGDRHKFLEATLHILSRYQEVVSTSFSTALVYAADSGSDIGLFDEFRPGYLINLQNRNKNSQIELDDILNSRLFPFKRNVVLANNRVKDWSDKILGKFDILSKESLKSCLRFVSGAVPVYTHSSA
jgi:hypothetical protein